MKLTDWITRLAPRRRHLGRRLALTIGVCALLASLLVAGVALVFDYRRAVERLDADFKLIAEREAPRIALAVWIEFGGDRGPS